MGIEFRELKTSRIEGDTQKEEEKQGENEEIEIIRKKKSKDMRHKRRKRIMFYVYGGPRGRVGKGW